MSTAILCGKKYVRDSLSQEEDISHPLNCCCWGGAFSVVLQSVLEFLAGAAHGFVELLVPASLGCQSGRSLVI